MADGASKVLVVDDEKAYLDDFLSLFTRKFDLITANSGEEALALLDKEPVAVIVSDQRMPKMTGSEFLAEAAKKVPRTVRILLTGYADIEAVVDAVNKGQIYRYISKDSPLKEIEITIQQALEKFQLEETNRKLLVAKKRLIKSLAVQENLSIVGAFGQQIHQRMEALVMNLFEYLFQMGKERDEEKALAEFQRLQGALSRLRELSLFSESFKKGNEGLEKGDLNHWVVESVQRASRASSGMQVDLQMDLDPLNPVVRVHPYSFQRMMKELLENAILFGDKTKKKVLVRVRYQEGTDEGGETPHVRIEVQDNGKGIAPEEIAKSFAPFYSSFQTTQPPNGSQAPSPDEYNLGPHFHYGFGLAIAQWIACMRLSGTIELESGAVGGTTAVVTIAADGKHE